MIKLTLFLCGDVMTGRGIDQILPHPSKPDLYEPYASDARQYVELAEEANGPIPTHAEFSYVWGDALAELERVAPELRIINLETAITGSDEACPKGINYRMHPANVPCLTAANIDCCALANNHLLDWGYAGLQETVKSVRDAAIKTAGAGDDLTEAAAPAVMDVPTKGRVIFFSFGSETSGIPKNWGATAERGGVNLLPDLSDRTVRQIAALVADVKLKEDVVVASIHWGGNWGYLIHEEERRFAHRLIDVAGIDLIHGHSSHHVKGIEVYREKLILYGCGDFINDYEGISGFESYRSDLVLMYFPTIDLRSGRLQSLAMTPMRIRKFRLNNVNQRDAHWLSGLLTREGRALGTSVVEKDSKLMLQWR